MGNDWEMFMACNVCVQKSQSPHIAIGCDHAGEQVNKILRIEGGVVGISNNPKARMRFVLTAPILAKLSKDLKEISWRAMQKSKKHHEANQCSTRRQNDLVLKLQFY